MIGKHYNIRKANNINLVRQYTIANCMQLEVYNEYLRAIDEGISKGIATPLDSKFFEERPADEISFSIKNY